MASSRLAYRSSRALFQLRTSTPRISRSFSAHTPLRADDKNASDFESLNKRTAPNVETHRKAQTETPLNPHMTNTTSTLANNMPSVGKDAPPPELLSVKDPKFAPKDSVLENTERMTGGTQGEPSGANRGLGVGEDAGAAGVNGELGVGEMEGAKFRVEPLRRTGEDDATMRARLLYQSRKRGTLESELLMSTFAHTHLPTMSSSQLSQYDLFLDENDWDIYYWATQEPEVPTSAEYAEGAGPDLATKTAQGSAMPGQDEWKREPAKGEWAQTVGTFKPAYRPVPKRWRDSEILSMLRQHVQEGKGNGAAEGKGKGGGLGFMPEIQRFD